jgi:uncharacterized protein (DUF2384 family)
LTAQVLVADAAAPAGEWCAQPFELIEIPGGISKVRDVIGRIEHGVYS